MNTLDTTNFMMPHNRKYATLINISNGDWEQMVISGIKEFFTYWDEEKHSWCLPISVGYDQNYKRMRKIIVADTQEKLWLTFGKLQANNKVLPVEHNTNEKSIISDKSNMLLKDYLDGYLQSLYGSVRSRTYTNNIGHAKHIINGLGHYRMCDLNKDILKKFINGFTRKSYKRGQNNYFYSQSMVNKVYDLLKRVISDAANDDGEQAIKINYMENIKKPRANKPAKEEYKPLAKKEIRGISQVVSKDEMISLWIHILIYTGVRPSEALALKFSDINYANKTIGIVRTLSKEDFIDPVTQQKTEVSKPIITNLKNERNNGRLNYQRRTLQVGDYLLTLLKRWDKTVKQNSMLMKTKKERGTEDFVFCSANGNFWLYDYYNQKYKRLLDDANIQYRKYNPYRFRHNYCTNILRQGIDLKTVQLIMGDNTTDMVLRVYANMDKKDILKGSGKYSEIMDKILSK